MSLKSRQDRFSKMCKKFPAKKLNELIADFEIDEELFKRLQTAIVLYMSKCLPSRNIHTSEDDIINSFIKNRHDIKNMTPNGQLVPKKHLILEFNMVVQAFMAIIRSANIDDFIDTWHVPLNIRYKGPGELPKSTLDRKHASEHVHSDSWIGESSYSVTVMIPILGDSKHNRVDFYVPPASFSEDWMGPKSAYADGADIVNKYRKLDTLFSKGHMYFADFATLHASRRIGNCGPRVSIDTTFSVKRSSDEKEIVHPSRVNERAIPADLCEIGLSKLFIFKNTEEEIFENPGFRNSSNFEIINI